MGIKRLLSGRGHLLGVSTIVLPLLKPSFQKHDERKYSPNIEGYNPLLTSNASSVTLLFQNKVMLLLKIMLIYDEANRGGGETLR